MNNPNNNSQNALFVLLRLKELSNLKHDLQLAQLLDIRPTTLSTWKKRDSLDYKLIVDFCVRMGYDLNYVFLGKTSDATQIEPLAQLLIDQVKKQFGNELDELRRSQADVLEMVDKIKTMQDIEMAKKKVASIKKPTGSF